MTDKYIGKLLDNRYEILEVIGTGGMATKLQAAQIATYSGADMIIANGADVCYNDCELSPKGRAQ